MGANSFGLGENFSMFAEFSANSFYRANYSQRVLSGS